MNIESIFMIAKAQWDKIRPKLNPFLDYNFITALMDSGSVSARTGWIPKVFEKNDCALITYVKNHSYGEYIFDWGWADAFTRSGIPYYPKLTSMVPFTPVTSQHFLMEEFSEDKANYLLKTHDEFYDTNNLSSAHFLFLNDLEINVFSSNNYLIRESIQYHFINEGFRDFDHFLSRLKPKRAKTIVKERRFSEIKIQTYTKDEIEPEHAFRMYQFYISTIANKNAHDYLNQTFFELIFKHMSNYILYIEASKNERPIAGALFLYDEENIYGRYWGSSEYHENLHFELCYYQGIEFCIKNKLKKFEAGAQGEHKIARGFRPSRTYSAHKIKNPLFSSAISHYITEEKIKVEESIKELSTFLPFK